MQRIGVDGRVLVDRYHGVGRVTYELLSVLCDYPGFEFVVFTDPAEPADRFDFAALQDRPNVTFVDYPVALPSLGQFARWPAALRAQHLDVMLYPYQLGASLVGGGRRLAIVHDCVFERDATYAPDRKTLVAYRLLTRLLLRRCEVVAPSYATADDVRRYYGVVVPGDHVVEWGVAPKFFTAPTSPAARPVPQPYLLHVGARRPHKNVPFLARVLAELDESMHLVLVGSADPRWPDDTMQVAERLGVSDRIHQLAGISDTELLAAYAHAHAFVYPSAVEGFGLPLLEAMAAGAPTVAGDIPVFREIGADAAEFAPLNDAQAWASAVGRLAERDHRDRLVERGRVVARAATWGRAADQLAAVLRESAKAGR